MLFAGARNLFGLMVLSEIILLSLPVVFASSQNAIGQLCMGSLKVPGEGVNTAPGGVYLTPP